MTATTRRAMPFKKHGRELVLDVLIAAGWMIFVVGTLDRVLARGRLVDLGLLLFVTMTAALFLLRQPARRSGAPWEALLGFVGTFWPMAALRPSPASMSWPGEVVQVVALAGMLVAMMSLGPSFGLAPADRGLRTAGLYRWMRHPLYAAELCFISGYLLANPSWRNFLGLIVGAAIQAMRLMREERILDGYADYAARVRYRLIPFVW